MPTERYTPNWATWERWRDRPRGPHAIAAAGATSAPTPPVPRKSTAAGINYAMRITRGATNRENLFFFYHLFRRAPRREVDMISVGDWETRC